jgi:hypothetical protein
MKHFNFFDYLFLAISPLFILLKVITRVSVVRHIFLKRSFYKAKIVGIEVISEPGEKPEFLYVVEFESDGLTQSGRLKGYSSPSVFKLGQTVLVYLMDNENYVNTISLKGRMLKEFFKTVIFALCIAGACYSLGLLKIVEFSPSIKLIIIGFGILALIRLIDVLSFRIEFLTNSIKTEGRIISFYSTTDFDQDKWTLPVIEFSTHAKVVQFTATEECSQEERLAKKVKLAYWKGYPEFAERQSFYSNWGEILFWLFLLVISGIAHFTV